jgi:hypothetical protein
MALVVPGEMTLVRMKLPSGFVYFASCQLVVSSKAQSIGKLAADLSSLEKSTVP